MKQTIIRLFDKTKNKQVVINAVLAGYITKTDYIDITGEFFPEPL